MASISISLLSSWGPSGRVTRGAVYSRSSSSTSTKSFALPIMFGEPVWLFCSGLAVPVFSSNYICSYFCCWRCSSSLSNTGYRRKAYYCYCDYSFDSRKLPGIWRLPRPFYLRALSLTDSCVYWAICAWMCLWAASRAFLRFSSFMAFVTPGSLVLFDGAHSGSPSKKLSWSSMR